MTDDNKTKKQLIEELIELRQRIADLEEAKTRLKHVEEALIKSDKKYRELTNLLPQTIFETDTVGKITYTNLKGLKAFGYDYEDLIKGANALQMVVFEDREKLQKNIENVLENGYQGDARYTALRKDGSTFPIAVYANVILHDNKQVGLRGLIIDISELKKAEEELRLSEEKYRMVVENASEIIVIIQQGFVKFINPRTEEITGYSRKELFSRPFMEFIHPDDRELVQEMYTKRTRGGKVPETYSFRALDRNNNTIWLQISAISTVWENKPATLNFLIDITDQKKAEYDLLQREKQLHQAQKMEAIGRLTGGIAHDFNNILTVILGYSDHLLKKYENNNDITPPIKNIKEAGEKAASLTQQLLAFSRRQFLQPKVINLNTIVSNTKVILKHLIGEDIHLIVNLEPSLHNSRLDPHQIEQVLMNLAINARDAMPKGGTLVLETNNVYLDENNAANHLPVKPGSYVMLSVSDNGIGMDKETQDHIFEPFFTTKDEKKGTGLGLSTVYGIVKQSNGYTWVHSELGKGTTFQVYFPIIDKDVAVEEEKEGKEFSLNGSENIILVEDDDIVREMISAVLMNKGYSVVTARDGNEAIDQINRNQNHELDLLITDVIMPGMNGFDLAETVKTRIQDIRVLYMSGYSDNAVTPLGPLKEDMPYLQKPFTADDLCIKIREILDN